MVLGRQLKQASHKRTNQASYSTRKCKPPSPFLLMLQGARVQIYGGINERLDVLRGQRIPRKAALLIFVQGFIVGE